MPSILCVDDDTVSVLKVEAVLRQLGHEPFLATRLRGALDVLRRRRFDLVLASSRLRDGSGLDLLDAFVETGAPAPILIMTGPGRGEDGPAALLRGAVDFITKPLRRETLRLAVQHSLENGRLRRENAAYRLRVAELQGPPPIVGRSPELRRVLERIDSVAPTRATVLLEGEPGTGKELFARALHEKSHRRERAIVTVHCGALSPWTAENALFGEESDPAAIQAGAFERAEQGTLVLSEVSELGLPLQGRILRTLQQQEFERGPGARPIPVDVRLIATTRRDLRAEVAAGRFRRDLYYRLGVVTIRVPALRERAEDLPLLVEHFARRAAGELGIRTPSVPEETLAGLRDRPWRGNVHELANVVERAVILCEDGTLSLANFDPPAAGGATSGEDLRLDTLKRAAMRRALVAAGGRRGRAAELLGISERTLRNMLSRERGAGPKQEAPPGADGAVLPDRPRRPPERARRPAAAR